MGAWHITPGWTETGEVKPGSQPWANMIHGMSPEEYRAFSMRWSAATEGDVIDLPADAVREVKETPKLEAPTEE